MREVSMSVRRVEIGLVSERDDLVDFYRDTFVLDVLEPRSFPIGTVHRLGAGDAMVKIMVPDDPPSASEPAREQFWDRAGLQYFALWVDDLDAVATRCMQAGGVVATGPLDVRPGLRSALVHDPDGNVIEVMEATP
jgi:predicted enzyme related to lactoylglutathione lyase